MPETSNYSPYGHPKGYQDPVTGLWVRFNNAPQEDGTVAGLALKLAVSFATLDAATLYTVPASQNLYLEEAFWDVTTAFTGGSSAAIGASASVTYTTKGSIIGGAGGDVLATLTAGLKRGTAGSAMAAGPVILPAGTIIRFDRIASAFTAGAGFMRLIGRLVS